MVDEKRPEAVFKMYLVVNTELAMDKGKIAGQVGHAVARLTRILERRNLAHGEPPRSAYDRWMDQGEPKIVLKGTEKLLLQLLAVYADKCAVVEVRDLGRTQIAPNSLTVVGFEPLDQRQAPTELASLKLL